MSKQLRDELAKKAQKMGIKVEPKWGVARLEKAISQKVLEDDHVPSAATVAVSDSEDRGVLIRRPGTYECRVTKAGDGQLFTEKEDGSRYEWDDTVYLDGEAAHALEGRHFVEILGYVDDDEVIEEDEEEDEEESEEGEEEETE